MGDQASGAFGGSAFELVSGDNALTAKVNTLISRMTRIPGAANVDYTLDDYNMDVSALKALMLTYLNGIADLPEQSVQLEYLKSEQRMLLPTAMAMLPYASTRPEVMMIERLVNRYWKVVLTPYAELRNMVATDMPVAQMRTTIDAVTIPADMPRTALHVWPTTYAGPNNVADSGSNVAMVFARISSALQFNCDLRDVGVLTRENMRMSDSAWFTHTEMPHDRFAVKIKTYSLQMIAALNYKACANCPLAAWTRAFGVSSGLLPDLDSHLQKEYQYVAVRPDPPAIKAVCEFEDKTEEMIYPVAMNLLGMFGLFHLAKDHTFRTGDANMDRIGLSYLMTLRTMVHSTLMDDMKTHQEALVRTAQHPFGLGQTYALALHLGHYKRLATPLQLRLTVTPPPVQRLFIVTAARDEWTIMPIGATFNEVFSDQLQRIIDETVEIGKAAPAYSGLFDLYGIQAQKFAKEQPFKDATGLMPIIYGYAMVQHSDENDKKEGLALALSLQNTASQHKTLSKQWIRLWEQYIDRAEKEGLVVFLKTAFDVSYR